MDPLDIALHEEFEDGTQTYQDETVAPDRERTRNSVVRQGVGQLAVLTVAIILGLIGFLLPLCWVGSFVLMGILWCSIADTCRQFNGGHGMLSRLCMWSTTERRMLQNRLYIQSAPIVLIPDSEGEPTKELQEGRASRDRRGLQTRVPSTRTSVSWNLLAIAITALVMVLVFILENLHATDAAFFGVHWRIPLGLDLLLAALLGATVVFVVGAARTLQLRLLARRIQ
jgi:uncharacterized integral membrane protein